MEPNTLIEQIFGRFTMESPILREIKLTTSMINDIPHLVIMEVFDSNANNIPNVGRTYELPMSVEALNLGKLLVSLVNFEKAFIRSATVNIRNFDFLGVFDSSMVNIGTHNFKVTQDIVIFYNYLEMSLDALARIFFVKNTNDKNYFKLTVENLSSNISGVENENEKYTRTFKYIGKEFEIVPEIFKTTFNTLSNSFRLKVDHINDNGTAINTNTVIDSTVFLHAHESIAAVSEMTLVEPGIINEVTHIDAVSKDFITIRYNTLASELVISNPLKEVYTNPSEPITCELTCNRSVNTPTIIIPDHLEYKIEGTEEWVALEYIPKLTFNKKENLTHVYDVTVELEIPTEVENPMNEMVSYRFNVLHTQSETVLTLGFKTNWAANAVPLKKK